MKLTSIWLSLLVCLGTGLTHAAELDAVINGPQVGKVTMDDLVAANPMAHLPIYSTGRLDQIIVDRGWTGPDDFAAGLSIGWNNDALLVRLDVRDDVVVPVNPLADKPTQGDQITLCFRNRSAAPSTSKLDADWNILVQPDPAQTRATIVPTNASTNVISRLGTIESRVVSRAGGYTVYLRLPAARWESPASFASDIELQAVFTDVDDQRGIESQHVLIPSGKSGDTKRDVFARVRFGSTDWVSAMPTKTLFAPDTFEVSIGFGNAGAEPRDLDLVFEDYKTGKPVKFFRSFMVLPPKSVEQGKRMTIDLSELPPGGYVLRAEAGNLIGDSAPTIGITSSRVAYMADVIERRSRPTQRPGGVRMLAINRTPNQYKETFTRLAGEGSLLWSVGLYDAASDEFPELVRPPGPLVVEAPAATEGDVPWALYAKNDRLSDMNRPLVVNFAESLFEGSPALSPLVPEWPQMNLLPEAQRLSKTAKRLFLLGIVATSTDADHPAQLEVRTPYRVLLNQVLAPKSETPGSRHLYVFRIWLSDQDRRLELRNLAQNGALVELDFMALLGPGPDSAPTQGEATMLFQGSRDASVFTKQIQTSAYMMKHYLCDVRGVAYPSLPGGRYQSFDPLATARLLAELPAWGSDGTGQRMVRGTVFNVAELVGPAGSFNLSKPAAIAGAYQAWRRDGGDRALGSLLWQNQIQQPITQILTEAETHPLGLVNACGTFGLSTVPRGSATLPMYQATDAALIAGSQLAQAMNKTNTAEIWRIAATRMGTAYQRQLIVPQGGLRVGTDEIHPAAYGLPESRGVSRELPRNSWIYGRIETGRPIAFNGDRRVFDTPYVLAGLEYAMDLHGYTQTPQDRTALEQTFINLKTQSPIASKLESTRFGYMDYDTSQTHIWMLMAALLLDQADDAKRYAEALVRYNYDEFSYFPDAKRGSKYAYLSPWTFKETPRIDTANGTPLGSVGDDFNAYHGVAALKTARLMAGIDDTDPNRLRLTPRLPADWVRVEVRDWTVAQAGLREGLAKVQYTYEKFPNSRYSITLKSDKALPEVELRIGPFHQQQPRAKLTINGEQHEVPTQYVGETRWAFFTVKDVTKLEVAASVAY